MEAVLLTKITLIRYRYSEDVKEQKTFRVEHSSCALRLSAQNGLTALVSHMEEVRSMSDERYVTTAQRHDWS